MIETCGGLQEEHSPLTTTLQLKLICVVIVVIHGKLVNNVLSTANSFFCYFIYDDSDER